MDVITYHSHLQVMTRDHRPGAPSQMILYAYQYFADKACPFIQRDYCDITVMWQQLNHLSIF